MEISILSYLLDPENTAEHETALALSDRMAQRALDYGGTCTGEHGVGYR